jgi:hypothetical protein
LPQVPQFALSLVRSRHLPLLPGVQQVPLWHCAAAWHVVVLPLAIFAAQLPPIQAPTAKQLAVTGLQAWFESHADAMLDM